MAEALEDREMEVVARPPEKGRLRFEPQSRRVRVFFGGVAIADSTHALLLLEKNHLPVYYFPIEDVRTDLMSPTDRHTRCPFKGKASYWTISAGGRTSQDAAWAYLKPIRAASALDGFVAFYWNKVDAWFEEDDEVYVHPRDPYHRVDVLNSSRHVRVVVEGETVAETTTPRLLFETGLPTRYYIPKLDVRMDLLRPSERSSRCPYKGAASYWNVEVRGKTVKDLVWTYREPTPECPKIENLLCFFNERADIYVDGELQPRPRTHWSDW